MWHSALLCPGNGCLRQRVTRSVCQCQRCSRNRSGGCNAQTGQCNSHNNTHTRATAHSCSVVDTEFVPLLLLELCEALARPNHTNLAIVRHLHSTAHQHKRTPEPSACHTGHVRIRPSPPCIVSQPTCSWSVVVIRWSASCCAGLSPPPATICRARSAQPATAASP